MNQDMQRHYARIVLTTGLNLQKGQNLLVRGEPIHWPFFNIVAEEAYKLGARFVRVDAVHAGLEKARYDFADPAYDEYNPGYAEPTLQSYLDENWCTVYFDGSEDPGIFEKCDQSKMGRINKAYSIHRKFYMKAVSANKIRWCVAALPTEAWGKQVFPALSASEAMKKLSESIIGIMRLDHPDPAVEWKRLSDVLQKRAEILNRQRLSHLHFHGGRTDLRVHLGPKSLWLGGSCVAVDGKVFMPNLPTEEVFTTPDYRGTEGVAYCTRPVEVLGSPVEGAHFRFEKGNVVEFGADKGRDILAQYLETDEHSKALGEVALVDTASPIFASGSVFHSILFDENAACHIALGNGYADAIEGGIDMTDEELDAVGHNNSAVHTDFMIGGPEVSVDGFFADGRKMTIIEKGRFVI
jgi:aminopeptidase